MAVKIFFCYAREDEELLNKLKAHLKPLQHKGLIDVWYDRDISAGAEWEQQIKEHLNTAQIILLLVSPDFMDSDYCYSIELQRALERHQRGEAQVIPIILRPVFWQEILGTLQALPTDAKPVKSWSDIDEAFFDVTKGIRTVVDQLAKPHPLTRPEAISLLHIISGHTSSVNCVAISSDGQTVASGEGKTIKLWNVATGKKVRTLTGHTRCIAFSPDGYTLASGEGKTIKRWNLATGKVLYTFHGHTSSVFSVAISPDGQTVASGGEDGTIKLWNPATREERQYLETKQGPRTSREIIEAARLAYESWETEQAHNTLTGHTSSVLSVAISPDGEVLASGSEDGIIKLWNLETEQARHTLTGHTSSVLSVAFSPDGQTLASGSADKTIKLWNLATGKEVRTLTGHTSSVFSVAISPDGRTLVSGSPDKTIKLWNPATGEERHTLTLKIPIYSFSVTFSPEGLILAGGGPAGSLWIWGN